MANGHDDNRPGKSGTQHESVANDDGGPSRHGRKERAVLIDRSSQANPHLQSLASLEQTVLSLLAETDGDGKAGKREARIFPEPRAHREESPALDEIRIFRPAKPVAPPPSEPAGGNGSTNQVAEPSEPEDTSHLAASVAAEKSIVSTPEHGAADADTSEEQTAETAAAAEEAAPPSGEDNGDSSVDRAPQTGAAAARGDEGEKLQDSWEPIDLGAILEGNHDAPQDSEAEPNDAASPAEKAGIPLSPANDDDSAAADDLAAEQTEGPRADLAAAAAVTEQVEESAGIEKAADADPDAAPSDEPDGQAASAGAAPDVAQDDGRQAADAVAEAPARSAPPAPVADKAPAKQDAPANSEVVRLRTRERAARRRDADAAAAKGQSTPPVLVADNAGLVADGLGKRFKQRQVLRGVGLTVQRGEVVGLLGPNGAGKTTCFYIITGLINPDYGTISLDDQDITELPMYRRARMGIGYLPQEPSIFRGLSVENNIRSVLESVEPDRQAREAMLDDLLAEFSITHLRRTPALALSGGERRRVEIARALASQPSFILLDEPLAGIDPIALGDIRNLVSHLKDRGIGVLITDHNVRETLEIVDRAYIIYNGEVLMSGKPSDIVAHDDVRRVYLGDGFSL